MTRPITAAMALLAEYAIAQGVAPIPRTGWSTTLPGDPPIKITIANAEPIKIGEKTILEPYHAYAEINGWPAAIFGPFDGSALGGTEEILLTRLRKLLGRED